MEILQQLASFWRDRDYAAVEKAIHPDAVLDVSRNVFNPGVHRGVDGLRQFMDTTDEMWKSFDVFPLEYIEAGDKVLRYTGGFRTREEAFEAAGLSE